MTSQVQQVVSLKYIHRLPVVCHFRSFSLDFKEGELNAIEMGEMNKKQTVLLNHFVSNIG